MIFRQWEMVLSGAKTQTRRILHEGDFEHVEADRTGIMAASGRWRVYNGQRLAVIPKRGKPAFWWRHCDGKYQIVSPAPKDAIGERVSVDALLAEGYSMARIRIDALRVERLHAISHQDALAEGVKSVDAYRDLWDSINGNTPGARWADNPLVVVIQFSAIKPE